jgi:hypothetical protein
MAPYLERQPSSRVLLVQTTSITSSTAGGLSVSPAAVFSKETFQIRVASTLSGWMRYGDGAQTAIIGDTWVPANAPPEYFTVAPGQTFAFLSTSTSSGYISITEMA